MTFGNAFEKATTEIISLNNILVARIPEVSLKWYYKNYSHNLHFPSIIGF